MECVCWMGFVCTAITMKTGFKQIWFHNGMSYIIWNWHEITHIISVTMNHKKTLFVVKILKGNFALTFEPISAPV